ncbi:MAG: PspC domain-containing protein [Flavobacteriaceae bacterium]|jgi:phage shock protein PspC (stress-responsive transcriptional regulator)|nr:PspC domain-containing protein [Flavobacteriaceae bacterium]
MKKLLREPDENNLSGVCQGFATYTDTDPVLWRVILLVLLFTSFPVVLFYLICWIAIPKKNNKDVL